MLTNSDPEWDRGIHESLSHGSTAQEIPEHSDIKVDDNGWQTVSHKKAKKLRPITPVKRYAWRETAASKAAKVVAAQRKEAAARREANRVRLFRESLASRWPTHSDDESEVVTPSSTRTVKRPIERSRKKFKRDWTYVPATVRQVSKSEAATSVPAQPVEVVSVPVVAPSSDGPKFETFKFPKLGFVGVWSDANRADSYNHANHWGVHLLQDDYLQVSVWAGLVDELVAYQCTRQYDVKYANYAVLQVKALNLCRDPKTGLSPYQRATSVMYAPAIAYNMYWNDIQNVSRVVTQSYYKISLWKGCLLAASGCAALARFFFDPGTAPRRLGDLAAVGLLASYARYAVSGAAPSPGTAPGGLGSGGLANFKKWLARKGSDLGLPVRTLTEISKPTPKPQRDAACMYRVQSGPFVKPDHDDAVRPRVEHVAMHDPSYQPRVFENNLVNQVEAVKARVLNATTQPDKAVISDFVAWVKRNKDHLFGKQFKIEELDFDEWLKNSNASPAVKARIKHAKEWLTVNGVDSSSDISAYAHSWSTRQSFVKEEFTNHRTPLGVTEKAPRLIQGAKPEFIALVSPFIAALQGRFKRVWNSSSSICFVSGVKMADAARVLDIDAQVFENDISAYDASFCPELLQLEVWIAKIFGAPLAVVQLMEANCNCHGVTSHGIRYKRDGGRCSGDPYTSLFNSVMNGLMHLYVFCRVKGCGVKEAMRDLKMLVSGDDNIGSHYGAQIDWASWMAKFGFEAKPHYRPNPELAEFCSMRLTPVEGGWTFVPKPGRVINKIAHCLDRPQHVTKESLIRGTALSLIDAAWACPPLKAFLLRILQLTEGHVGYKPKDEPWKMLAGRSEPSVATWEQLGTIYGWTPQIQLEWEALLSGVTLETQFSHPYLDLLLDTDTDGPTNYASSDGEAGTLSCRVPYDWSISNVERNRQAHAKTGNIFWFLSKLRIPGELLEVYYRGHESCPHCGHNTTDEYVMVPVDENASITAREAVQLEFRKKFISFVYSNALPPDVHVGCYVVVNDDGCSFFYSKTDAEHLERGEYFSDYVPVSAVEQAKHRRKQQAMVDLVGVEPEPGPKSRKQNNRKKSKQRQVIKIVEKQVKPKQSIGRQIGSGIGGFVGDMAQKAIATISGMGDYTVRQNSLYDGMIRSSGPPKFAMKNAQRFSVTHREYVRDINSTGSGFNIFTFLLNPTFTGLFPWLANVAVNFEQFKFKGLVFEFKTTSATAVASTNTALGAVIMATQYNTLEAPFSNKLQMDQYEYAVSTNPSMSAIHPVECAPQLGNSEWLYCDILSSGDPRLASMGNFSIATVGQQAASVVGELWVSYEIEFTKPRLSAASSADDKAFWATYSSVTNIGGFQSTDMFRPIGNVNSYSNLPISNMLPICLGSNTYGPSFGQDYWKDPGPNTITFPKGAYGVYCVEIVALFTTAMIFNNFNTYWNFSDVLGGALIAVNCMASNYSADAVHVVCTPGNTRTNTGAQNAFSCSQKYTFKVPQTVPAAMAVLTGGGYGLKLSVNVNAFDVSSYNANIIGMSIIVTPVSYVGAV